MSTLGRGAPDYTVNLRGNTYVAEPRTNNEALRGTSLNQLWLDINSELGRGPAVEFGAGRFTIDDTLEVEYEQTVVLGQGPQRTEFFLAAGVDDDLWRNNGNNYYRNVKFQGMMLNGNKDNNAATSRGIEWIVTDATGGSSQFFASLQLHNIAIQDCNNYGLIVNFIAGSAGMVMDDFRIAGNGGETVDGAAHQVEINRVSDSWFGGGGKNTISSILVRGTSSASNHFNNIYIGGGTQYTVVVEGGDANYAICGNIFNNCIIDNSYGTAIRLDGYAKRNMFANCYIQNQTQTHADGTEPAVLAQGNSSGNIFQGCFFGHTNIATTNRWSYAYEEAESADNNQLIGCVSGYGAVLGGNAEHFATDEYNIAGTTVVDGCYKQNGSLWNA